MKKKLLHGITFHYASESHQLHASFKRTLGGSHMFVIELNARVVHAAKTFEAFKKTLEKLVFEKELILIDEQ